MTDLKERVESGAQLMDEYVGDDWFNKIDLAWLDIACADRCVLGQTVGFARGVAYCFYRGETTTMHGFAASDKDYPALTEAWREKIRELQTA